MTGSNINKSDSDWENRHSNGQLQDRNLTCHQRYPEYNESWCPTVFDNWLCWPTTRPSQNVTLSCPQGAGILVGGKAYRICTDEGKWEGYDEVDRKNGFTHYDNCIIPQLVDLVKMCDKVKECKQIFWNARTIEMVGLSFSLITLIVSLYIFFNYRVLKNNRTKIHKNLFIATLLQVVIRLIKYVDQIFKEEDRYIERTPVLSEACNALLEYTKTAMFMWMFIEGLYLHNMITVTIFQEYSYIKLYFYLGWLIPAVLTAVWVTTMIVVGNSWDFYFFLPYYWILEGPRSAIIILNLLFLVNIIRVLIVKLQESQTGEIEQVRKAVRAAIFLLPLMGITNIFFWVDYRLFTEAWKLALWSYTSYFLNTFQGFFVAVLYCFLNAPDLPEGDHQEVTVVDNSTTDRWIRNCWRKINSGRQEDQIKDTEKKSSSDSESQQNAWPKACDEFPNVDTEISSTETKV